MARLTGMFQRGGIWWLRVMVPTAVQQQVGGRTKIVRSLGTSDRKLATTQALATRAKLLTAFASATPIGHSWTPWLNSPLQASGGPSDAGGAPTPPEPSPSSQATFAVAPRPIQRDHSLREVYKRWAEASEGGPDAKRACDRALKLYEGWAEDGGRSLLTITRPQGHAFKAWLLEQVRAGRYSSKTVHGFLVSVCGLLRFAHQELEWTTRHCWRGIRIDYETETPRHRWSASHLEAMAALPLFATGHTPSGWQSGGLAAYWMPLLGLYTGCTVSELAQLKLSDVTDERESGLWLRITDTGEGQALKTSQRRRAVPVHSELVRLGFDRYVAALRAARCSALWPDLRLRPSKPGTHFSNWWGKFRRDVDGSELLPDFHSMRHTARSAMADTGLDAALLDAITGHGKRGSDGVKTYTHFSPATFRAAIETIRYPALQALRPIDRTCAWRSGQETPTCRKTPHRTRNL